VATTLKFTREEEKWLEKQFDLIDAAFQSVSVGKDLLQVRP
jgi:hypothetical protein